MGDRDFDRLRELVAPGTVFVDRRLLGAPQLGLDGFIEWQRGYADVPRRFLVAQLRVDGRVGLVRVRSEGMDAGGGNMEWNFLGVGTFDATGRYTRVETYAEDDWDAALARFDELSVAEPGDRLETAASRRYAETVRAAASGADTELAELAAPEFRWNDRRRVVNFGDNDRTGAVEHILYNRAQGYEMSIVDVVAVRGEHFALTRTRVQKATDEDTGVLDLIELDERGRLLETTHFDDEDLGTAVHELERRYVATEGTEHAAVLQPFVDYWRSYNARDWDEARSYVTADFTFVDHSLIGAGSSVQGADQAIEFVQGLVDQVPDVV